MPLQYSCLESSMDRGAWSAAVHVVAGIRTRLIDFTFTFHFHALEKEMATHSSVLAWGIPGTAEPGGLQTTGLPRVGHDWATNTHTRRVKLTCSPRFWLPCSLIENFLLWGYGNHGFQIHFGFLGTETRSCSKHTSKVLAFLIPNNFNTVLHN